MLNLIQYRAGIKKINTFEKDIFSPKTSMSEVGLFQISPAKHKNVQFLDRLDGELEIWRYVPE